MFTIKRFLAFLFFLFVFPSVVISSGFGVNGGAFYLSNGNFSVPTTVSTFESKDVLNNFGGSDKFDVVQTSYAVKGDSALTYTSSGAPGYIGSTSGLDEYLDQGQTLRIWLYPTDDATDWPSDIGVMYGKADETDNDNGYYAHIDLGNDDLELDVNDSELASDGNGSFTVNTHYLLEVQWKEDNTHILKVFDDKSNLITSLTTTDSTITDGGLGFHDSCGSSHCTVYWDDLRIID